MQEFVDKLSKKGSKIAELIEKGREQGYLTYADVNDHLPEDISDPDQVDEIIGMINDLGLQVHETAPDADDLLLAESEDSDDIALEQAAEALAAVENETGRTTDPVRMYMREMGTVDLLTREGEIEIAKRIEEGMRDLLAASVYYPKTVEYVIEYHQMVKDGEKKERTLTKTIRLGVKSSMSDEEARKEFIKSLAEACKTKADMIDKLSNRLFLEAEVDIKTIDATLQA